MTLEKDEGFDKEEPAQWYGSGRSWTGTPDFQSNRPFRLKGRNFKHGLFSNSDGPWRFRASVEFHECHFPASFSLNGEFQKPLTFKKCTFEGQLSINGNYSEGISFDGCTFDGETTITGNLRRISAKGIYSHASFTFSPADQISFEFDEAKFYGSFNCVGQCVSASFDRASFKGNTEISISAIELVSFSKAEFHEQVKFTHSIFNGGLNFSGGYCNRLTDFRNVIFKKSISISRRLFRDQVDFTSEPDERCPSLEAWGAEFEGKAVFNNRKFSGPTNFSLARFLVAPHFHDCSLFSDTRFDKDSFTDFDTIDAEACYRSLRQRFADVEDHQRELMFFGFEMEAKKRKEKRAPIRFLYILYDWLSGYGLSIRKPLFWLVFSFAAFCLIFAKLDEYDQCYESAPPCITSLSGERAELIVSFALAQSLPFIPAAKESMVPNTVGVDTKNEKRLWRSLPYRLAARVAGVLLGIVSVVLLFLVVLGFRNLFRLK